ncbi:hypothetical protein AYI69_g11160 [Smittium culicis]|uniref:Uncharacterized protein n=1 Tax=Smittium culicis TaxID=133412 RepID=A0A1R1X0Q0_9FUNG|nr:hypothetical protein AYI69_g11160 [Smittium culicis]
MRAMLPNPHITDNVMIKKIFCILVFSATQPFTHPQPLPNHIPAPSRCSKWHALFAQALSVRLSICFGSLILSCQTLFKKT